MTDPTTDHDQPTPPDRAWPVRGHMDQDGTVWTRPYADAAPTVAVVVYPDDEADPLVRLSEVEAALRSAAEAGMRPPDWTDGLVAAVMARLQKPITHPPVTGHDAGDEHR